MKVSRYVFGITIVSLVVIIIAITIIYVSFGIKKFHWDACVDEFPLINGTNNSSTSDFCIITFDNPWAVFSARNMWIVGHFLVPFFIYMIFASFLFPLSEYVYAQINGFFPDKWNLYSCMPYIFSFTVPQGVLSVHEMMEGFICLYGSEYFCEFLSTRHADTTADLFLHLVASVYGMILILFGIVKPTSYLFMTRKWWKTLIYFGLFIIWIIVFLINFLQIQTTSGDLRNFGQTLYFPVSLLFGLSMIYMDLREVRHSKDLRRCQVLQFWFCIYLMILILWITSFELILRTYISLAIGIGVHFIVIILIKLTFFKFC